MRPMTWSEITFLRWEIQHGYCPICGKKINLNDTSKEHRMVGHHEYNRSRGGTDSLENCVSRHASCEMWAHKVAKDGNPKPYQINRYRQFGE